MKAFTATVVGLFLLSGACGSGNVKREDQVYLTLFTDPAQRSLVERVLSSDERGVERHPLARNRQVNFIGGNGLTPLILAVMSRDLPMTRTLLELGADPNLRGPQTAPPLTLIARFDSRLFVEALLDAGADPDIPDGRGEPPLIIAIYAREWNVVEALVDGGADVNKGPVFEENGPGGRPIYSDTPLTLTGNLNHFRRAIWLMDHGADPWTPSSVGGTLIDTARDGTHDPAEEAARVELLRRLDTLGFPIPPPDAKTMRQLVKDGRWPPPNARRP